jgi:AraC family transcriptional activator FtrA
MSRRSFVRGFVEATGSPPGEWLTAVRVEAAKGLLRERRGSLDDIAMAVGFGSAYGLRHHFRQRLGISPSQYRARFAVEPPVPVSSR